MLLKGSFVPICALLCLPSFVCVCVRYVFVCVCVCVGPDTDVYHSVLLPDVGMCLGALQRSQYLTLAYEKKICVCGLFSLLFLWRGILFFYVCIFCVHFTLPQLRRIKTTWPKYVEILHKSSLYAAYDLTFKLNKSFIYI